MNLLGGRLIERHTALRGFVADPLFRSFSLWDGGLSSGADSYVTMDAVAFYDPNPNLSFNLGVYNISDVKYFNAQDVAGVLASNRNLDLLRAPAARLPSTRRYAGDSWERRAHR